jgi:hypothetical protein
MPVREDGRICGKFEPEHRADIAPPAPGSRMGWRLRLKMWFERWAKNVRGRR